MPTLFFIHTVLPLAPGFKTLAARTLPDWKTLSIVDESLLADTIERGTLSPRTVQRLATHVFSAADAGAEAIVVTCSTLGGAVDHIRPLLSVPLFRIDRGMAEEAVRKASRIGVLATLPTTLSPTTALIRDCARQSDRECEIVDRLCEGAFSRLADGDRSGHDARVVSGFEIIARSADIVVLAQASMASALEGHVTDVPYLTSPELGMEHIARRLGAG